METVTVMTKAEAVVKMEEQISKLQQAYDAVQTKLQEKEDAKYAGQRAVEEMSAQIVALREEMNNQTELAKAKELLAEIEGLTQDVQLQESINAGLDKKYQEVMLLLFGDFFKEDKEAVTLFREVEQALLLQMSMISAEEDVVVMNGFANSINVLFSDARIALVQAGLATQADKSWNTVHLNRMSLYSKTAQLKQDMNHVRRQLGF